MGRKIFAGFVAIAFFYIAYPLLFPLAMGGVLAVLFLPCLEHLEKKNIPSSLGSTLLTLGITVVLILPTSLLVFFAAKTGFQQLQSWKKSSAAENSFVDTVLRIPKIHGFMVWITHRFPINMSELSDALQQLAESVGSKLTELLGGLLPQLPGMVVGLAVIVVSVYFFLIDGRKLVLFLKRNSVFSASQTNKLIDTLAEMCRSVILAAIISGGLQAILEVLACVLTGTPDAAFIGLLVFVSSFIPLIGSSPITFIVAVQQLIEGRQIVGVCLLVMALVLIAVDNTVRPLFLRGSANLHPLLGFIAAFGGLQTLGFLGVFLGPIIAALFVATLQILTTEDELIKS